MIYHWNSAYGPPNARLCLNIHLKYCSERSAASCNVIFFREICNASGSGVRGSLKFSVSNKTKNRHINTSDTGSFNSNYDSVRVVFITTAVDTYMSTDR